jgi:hypothetical protein
MLRKLAGRWFPQLWATVALLTAPASYAFPDAIRKGYNNCGTCHYSPLGGGPQTPYGKGTAPEIFPTWRGLVLDPSENLIYGADARRLVMTGREPFLMQEEAHLGVTAKGATIVGTVNPDGPIGLWASYRYKGLGVRLGRFKPAYAIPYDDHTVPILGNKKNYENNNIELELRNRKGEIVITRILGNSRFSNSGPVIVGRDELAGTANLFLGKRCKSGGTIVGTAADSVRQALHVQCSFNSELYGMGEWSLDQGDRFGLLGYEILTGLHVRFTSFGPESNYRIGLRWIPIPGLEATGELEKERAFLVSHLWF